MSRFKTVSGWGVKLENIPAWSTLGLLLG